jgi:hypothetical protein
VASATASRVLDRPAARGVKSGSSGDGGPPPRRAAAGRATIGERDASFNRRHAPSNAIEDPTMKPAILLSIACLAAALVAAAPAEASRKERDAARLALVEKIAGAPVDRIVSFTLSDWQPLDDNHLVVFRGPVTAWLLTVREPCLGLTWARTVGISSTGGSISRRFDRVLFRDGLGAGARHEQCRIEEIRPVDWRQVRAAERAARDQGASGGT